jgi:hypothetical protein
MDFAGRRQQYGLPVIAVPCGKCSMKEAQLDATIASRTSSSEALCGRRCGLWR